MGTKELFDTLVPMMAPIVTVIVGFIGYQIRVFVNSKIGVSQQNQIVNTVDASVKWVEQVTGTNPLVTGEQKFNMAKDRAQGILAGMQINVTDDQIDTLIEAFVLGLSTNDGFVIEAIETEEE